MYTYGKVCLPVSSEDIRKLTNQDFVVVVPAEVAEYWHRLSSAVEVEVEAHRQLGMECR